MTAWDKSVVIANSESLTAGTPVSVDVADLRSPEVLVALEDLEGAADDTVTIRVVGDAGSYEVDERTLSATGSYIVEAPQAESLEFESANGVTYSAETRANP